MSDACASTHVLNCPTPQALWRPYAAHQKAIPMRQSAGYMFTIKKRCAYSWFSIFFIFIFLRQKAKQSQRPMHKTKRDNTPSLSGGGAPRVWVFNDFDVGSLAFCPKQKKKKKKKSLIQCLIWNGHLYLSGVWLSVNLRMDNKKTCWKGIRPCAQYLLTILDAKVNIFNMGESIWLFNNS